MNPMNRIRPVLALMAALCALGLLAPTPAASQAVGTIRGKIVEAGSQRPLSGVQVSVAGTSRGTLTNASGDYLIVSVPAGTQEVRAQMIGFRATTQSVQVTSGDAARADFALSPSAIAMDEVVVTGTAGAVSKRTLGNSITTVDAADITEKTTTNTLTELLQGKTVGVQILPNSGVLGAAADIRIRGASSLTGGDPVIYVDGIRYNSGDLGSFTPSGAAGTGYSGQRTSAFDFINPHDIESIEVIKGPAAATLYGAEAANGVIQIITKKGARGEQQIQYTARLERGTNEWALPIPDNYTTCTAARIAETTGGNPVWPGCQGVPEGTVLRDSPLRRDPLALREGSAQRASLSMRGGGDRYSFYIGGEIDDNSGIFHNSYSDRKSLRANFVLTPSDKLSFTANTSYARGDLRMPVGDESAQGMLLSAFRGRPGRVTFNPLNEGWATTRPEQANEYNNTTRSDRLTLGTTVNYALLPWFRNRLTLGMDYTASLAQVLSPAGSTDADFGGVREGFIAQRVPRSYVYTVDYVGNIDREIGNDFRSTFSVGAQANSSRYEAIYASGTGFGAPDVTMIGNAQSQYGSNSFSESKSVGVFAQEQIAWRNRLFLTGAVRADDNSSFGENFDWIYYPKASVSWILSEEPAVTNLFQMARVNDFKLRAAYGQAGNAPGPFSASQTYTVDKGAVSTGQIVSVLRARSLGNPDLVAERGVEFEFGFDAALMNDLIGLEATYYNKRMRDVIISTGAPGSTGFGGTFYGFTSGVLKNLGETLNTGLELAVNATPVQTQRITWDTRVSLATNQNELVSFGDDRKSMSISGQSYGAVQQHRAGYPLGGYWIRVPQRNADGTPVLSATGSVVLEDTVSFIGSSIPTREISFSNTFTLFRDFRVFALLDYKGGHYLYNYREYARCNVSSQLNCERMNDPALADHPDRPLWRTRSTYIEPADFLKLRDLSLTYSLPSEWAQRLGTDAASLTLAGHNLGLWSDYTGVDPEVNGYGNRSFARTDVYPVPMTRRLTASLNVSF
jgi:TonB-linked SusC/RagA family outer membrane protein